MGEPRDIPDNANIHYSVIERMRNNPNYRPGNLIVGGGGRGVRVAPPELGIGNWEPKDCPGDVIKETFVRKTGNDHTYANDQSQPQHNTLVQSMDED